MTTLFTQAPAVATHHGHSADRLRSLLAGLVLAIALIGVVAQTAPTAHADAGTGSTGHTFLGALASNGITFTSGQAAIAAAHQVCDELDQGKQATAVANEAMAQSNLDAYHAGYFVGASIAALCPQHSQ
jgi:beta-lactamase class A